MRGGVGGILRIRHRRESLPWIVNEAWRADALCGQVDNLEA
jgi:hypothetical protein